ncbi:hypothetical protein RB213_001512, partial [Colletotrichum asianum]
MKTLQDIDPPSSNCDACYRRRPYGDLPSCQSKPTIVGRMQLPSTGDFPEGYHSAQARCSESKTWLDTTKSAVGGMDPALSGCARRRRPGRQVT